ncbi:MAG: sugar phosphate isomerase/epimerase [Bryobacterales bacterium]|nr:sugar phosphate isomerase/epimerase [Bryobacterales bacterium]
MNRREFIASMAAMGQSGASGIRLGCQTRVFGSPLPQRDKLLAALDDLAALGFKGFETNFRSVEHSFENPAPLRAEFEKRRIPLIALHVSSPAEACRKAPVVKALGGSLAVVSGGKLPGPVEISRYCDALNQAGVLCRGLGVQLSMHNHGVELENRGLQLRETLAGTDPDAVTLMLDVGNPFPPEYSVPQIVREHSKRIAGFHLRDTSGGAEVLMGAGEFDFAGLARAIREANWAGWLIVEVNRRADIPSRKLAEMSLAHIRKTMGIQ